MANPIGIVLYRGPSRLDGSPIVAIATLESSNRKTGDMVQTWILRDDMLPLEAVREGADDAVCGDCPHRRSTGGACYVNVGQAPQSVYRTYARGRYVDMSRDLQGAALVVRGRMVRLGAYGDPLAVPAEVWRALTAHAKGHTGYTHQWRREGADEYRTLVMASCDSPSEHASASLRGWRTFVVLGPDDAPPERTFECLSDAKGTSCEDCGACDGAKAGRVLQAASVWIRVHGALASRFDSAAIASRARRVDLLRVI
jgi:hypothetical protein